MTNLPARLRRRVWRDPDVLIAALLFVCMYSVLALLSPSQLSTYSTNNFLVLICTLGVAAAGTTLVLLTGGFDLSVAGTIGLANVLAATLMPQHPDQVWGIAIVIVAIGLVVGVVNGFFVAVMGLQSIAVTLSTYIVLSGVALVILPTAGGSVPASFGDPLTIQAGFVSPALLVLLGVVGLWLIFSRTRTGIGASAIGADVVAARMSGIPVRRVQVTCYGLAGALYACAGLYYSAVTASGDPRAGQPFLLTAFAAAALGFVSFRGGSGSVIATLFGAATLTVIPKLLFATGVADFWTGAFEGAVILLALTIPRAGLLLTRVLRKHPTPLGNYTSDSVSRTIDAAVRK